MKAIRYNGQRLFINTPNHDVIEDGFRVIDQHVCADTVWSEHSHSQ